MQIKDFQTKSDLLCVHLEFISSWPLRAQYPVKPNPTSLQVALTNGGHALPLHLDMHLCALAPTAACGSAVVMERLAK